MKIAVLADVHANFPALQAVTEHIDAWRPDVVIVAGDLVNRGPRPAECLSLVLERQRSHGWLLVRGNHEDYVIHQTEPNAPRNGPVFEVHKASFWTCKQLGYQVAPLVAMPMQQSLTDPVGGQVRIVHGSMLGNRDGIYPDTPDRDLELKIAPPPPLLVVGHTHLALVRRLNSTLVVNAGSAGLPFDGNRRAAYAQLTWQRDGWKAHITRVDYDLAQAERDFYETGFSQEGGPLVKLVQVELRQARAMLGGWVNRYQSRALAGKIGMEQSVIEFMRLNT
jgi:putative phosphoesterase